MYYVYAIYNQESDKLYIGQTNNLSRRVIEHNDKILNKGHYTSKYPGQWQLIYQEESSDRSHAIARERELKSYRGREFLKKYIQKN